jgi:outer membrane protein TolC
MGETLQLPLDMQVAAAYITARVDQLSLMLIEQAQGAFSREDALLAKQVRMPTLQAAGRRSLQQRMDAAAAAAQSHTARRNDALALLATLCGMQPPDLMARIGPALRNEKLPRFVAPVPHALPAALLMQRADVALASALYHLDPQPLLDGWIEPDESAAGTDGARASADAPVGEPLVQVIARAQREVAQAMAEVVRRNQAAAVLYERAAASRLSVEKLQTGSRTDGGSELELLEDYEQLLLHSQQLTSASADLALTWIKLLYRLGNGGKLNAPLQGSNSSQPDDATGTLRPMHGQAGRNRSPLV